MTGASRSPEEVEEHIEARIGMQVLNGPEKPEAIANAVLFLVSSFIAGQPLYVDGGRTDRI